MDVNAFLLAYSIILSSVVVFISIYVMYKDKYYNSKFIRNLVHIDNILNNHKLSCIEASKNHYAQVRKLNEMLDRLIKKCNDNVSFEENEMKLNEEITKRELDEYTENQKIEVENKKAEVKSGKLKKLDDNDYVGDFIEEWCPICNAQLLGNTIGQKWCSFAGCKYGLTSLQNENRSV